jgi:hypothetical protein
VEIKNPFKPKVTLGDSIDFKNTSPGAKAMYLEELAKEEEKKKLEEMYPDGIPTQEELEYEPRLNTAPKTPTKTFQVLVNPDDLAITQKGWSTLCAQIFLEVFNAEKSLLDVANEIQQIMGNQGIEVNIDDIKKMIEATQERMLRISIAKTMAYGMGLTKDWEMILQREMDLIYPKKSLEISSSKDNK